MTSYTELFKIKYTGGLIKAKNSGDLATQVKNILEIEGVSDVSTPSVENISTGYFYVDVTYDTEETDRTSIAQQIEQMSEFDTVIFG